MSKLSENLEAAINGVRTCEDYAEAISDFRPYIELEYLQTDGNQYIDTGLQFSNNDMIFAGAATWISKYNNNDGFLWCANGNNRYGRGDLYFNSSASKLDLFYGNNSSVSINKQINFNTKVVFNVNINNAGAKCCINNSMYDLTYSNGTYSQSNILLFKHSVNGSFNFVGKFYYLKIYSNGVLVKDFIPVKRKSDNVICLYDKVSKTFFTNSGTGSFAEGQELAYKELKYIQSTGTQHIDTGIVFTKGFRTKLKINVTATSNNVYIAGSMHVVSNTYKRSYIGQYQSKLMLGMDSDNVSNVALTTGEHIIDASTVSGNGFFVYDNNTIASSNATYEFSDQLSAYLFWFHSENSYPKLSAKLYYAQFYNEDGVLVRDFIPVIKNSNLEVCLFDKISREFFVNQGTGKFIAGKN